DGGAMSLPVQQSVEAPATERPGSDAADGPPMRLVARGIQRVYADRKREVPALGPLDLQVRDGEFVCIVGPSGCGKSTLLGGIAALSRPTSGEMDILHADPGRHLVSVVFQEHSIFPWQTVEQNVRTGLDIATNLSKQEKRERVDHWLRKLGLAPFATAYP